MSERPGPGDAGDLPESTEASGTSEREGNLDGDEPRVPPGGVDLRPGSDDCYKCSACDLECPVAAVDEEFPGPKFQGPEQWRLKREGEGEIDDSIEKCSNCMRCDSACPSGVPLTQMHNTLRSEYKDRQGLSRKAIRDRLLANYGRLAGLASRMPRIANLVLRSKPIRWITERLLGITAEREFPAFAETTFREWWEDRGGPRIESETKRVAYFHGDYANYNTPDVAKALVRVYEHFGYEVRVPEQRCSGTPMFANGAMDDAERAARFNVETFSGLIEAGYDVVCSCTSCSMALREEYPELFAFEGVDRVAASTYDAIEYLRINENPKRALREADRNVETDAFAYHAPCHARNQGLAGQTVELADEIEDLTVEDVGDSCSGISGTYGWKREHYDTSMAVGEEMFEHMEATAGNTGLTECPTCAMQMEHGTGYEVDHPLEVLEEVLVG